MRFRSMCERKEDGEKQVWKIEQHRRRRKVDSRNSASDTRREEERDRIVTTQRERGNSYVSRERERETEHEK